MVHVIACVLVVGLVIPGVAASGATFGFIDSFAASGVNGWTGGTVLSNPASGGVGGLADGYLNVSRSTLGNLGTFSQNAAYQGNWQAAGITRLVFSLNDLGSADGLEIHVLISDDGSLGTTWQTNAGFGPPLNSWQSFSVDMTDASQWTQLRGSTSFSGVLQTVSKLQFRHDLASTPGVDPDDVTGNFGLDSITLAPEPASAALLLAGLAMMVRRPFSRRSRKNGREQERR